MHSFPITEQTAITHAAALPAAADVVVIGGGVIGVCTALYLAQAKQKVVLLEKGRIAGEQSSRNWGWIRQQGRDLDELPIAAEANRLWHDLASRTNTDIGLRQTGVTYLAADDAALARYEAWQRSALGFDLGTRILSAKETAAMFPGAVKSFAGAMTTPTDMRAEPWLAVPALAGIAVREGALLTEGCAVRRLELHAGQVAGVQTERGLIKTGRVVLAGGAWSRLFLRQHGVDLPQLSVRQTVVATQDLPEVHTGAAASRAVAFRRRADGGYTLSRPGTAELYIGPDAFRSWQKYMPQLRSDPFGQSYLFPAPKGFPDAWGTKRSWSGETPSPFEQMRILNPSPNLRHVRNILKGFSELYPEFGTVKAKSVWAGMIDTMPDVVPVVDQCAQIPGLVIGTGMSGHGFGIGPGMGRVLAALALDRDPGHDLSRFRACRFSDGSAIRLGPDV